MILHNNWRMRLSALFFNALFFSGFFSFFIGNTEAAPPWQTLATGIDYRIIYRSYPGLLYPRQIKLHVLRFRQGLFRPQVHSFHDLAEDQTISLIQLRKQQNALLAMSGGFYQESGFRKPVGLVIVKQKTLFRLATSFSGVIWIRDNQLVLSPTEVFLQQNPQPDYALQGYPRLVDPPNQLGVRPTSFTLAHRAALCTQPDYFLILITDKTWFGLSLYELAQIAQAPETADGLGCEIAINLDGGPAPGISVDPQLLNLHITEGWQLPNAITISR